MSQGRPPKVSDEDILRTVATVYGPATVSDIIETVDINRSGMNKRTDKLVEKGWLNEKKVGANAVVYWLSDEGQQKIGSEATG